MNFNFGLLPHKQEMKKKNKKEILGNEAILAVTKWLQEREQFPYAIT